MAEVSFAVSTIGLVIPFSLINLPLSGASGTIPISNAINATSVTWISQRGEQRPLTLSQAVSATFTYVISASDSRSPHIEEGYLEVAFGEHKFSTSTFAMRVHQHF